MKKDQFLIRRGWWMVALMMMCLGVFAADVSPETGARGDLVTVQARNLGYVSPGLEKFDPQKKERKTYDANLLKIVTPVGRKGMEFLIYHLTPREADSVFQREGAVLEMKLYADCLPSSNDNHMICFSEYFSGEVREIK